MDILIIEDNEELGQLIYDFIINSDYSADWVKSAEDALQCLEKENYRLLLLDVMLPGQDGFAALNNIRKNHNMPVLMMSARTDDDSKILGMETGADDYIEKPFSIPVLLSLNHHALPCWILPIASSFWKQAITVSIISLSFGLRL